LGSGSTDAGHQDRTRKSQAPHTASTMRPVISGAMAQQCGDSGNYSTPQKFVQLVGCRDPKARPWVRPDSAKR